MLYQERIIKTQYQTTRAVQSVLYKSWQPMFCFSVTLLPRDKPIDITLFKLS